MYRMTSALSALFMVAMTSEGWAQQGGQYYGPHMWSGGWFGWFMGPIMMLLFIGLIVAVVVIVIRALGGGSAPSGGSADRSLEILRERFARGEIDQQEFEVRKKALGG